MEYIADAIVITEHHADVDLSRVMQIMRSRGEEPQLTAVAVNDLTNKITEFIQTYYGKRINSFRFYGVKVPKTEGGQTGTTGPQVNIR